MYIDPILLDATKFSRPERSTYCGIIEYAQRKMVAGDLDSKCEHDLDVELMFKFKEQN